MVRSQRGDFGSQQAICGQTSMKAFEGKDQCNFMTALRGCRGTCNILLTCGAHDCGIIAPFPFVFALGSLSIGPDRAFTPRTESSLPKQVTVVGAVGTSGALHTLGQDRKEGPVRPEDSFPAFQSEGTLHGLSAVVDEKLEESKL